MHWELNVMKFEADWKETRKFYLSNSPLKTKEPNYYRLWGTIIYIYIYRKYTCTSGTNDAAIECNHSGSQQPTKWSEKNINLDLLPEPPKTQQNKHDPLEKANMTKENTLHHHFKQSQINISPKTTTVTNSKMRRSTSGCCNAKKSHQLKPSQASSQKIVPQFP